MIATDWIEQARSLTHSSSVPLGVPVSTHMDMLLRDTRRDLRTACNALGAVLELHHRREWTRVRDFMHFGQTEFPDQCDRCHVEYPCLTVQAITTALGVES